MVHIVFKMNSFQSRNLGYNNLSVIEDILLASIVNFSFADPMKIYAKNTIGKKPFFVWHFYTELLIGLCSISPIQKSNFFEIL